MKLIRRMTLSYLLLMLPLLLLGGVLTYWLVSKAIAEETDEMLWKFKKQVEQHIAQGDTTFGMTTPDKQIFFFPVSQQLAKPFFTDTLIFDNEEKENIPYRTLRFTTRASGNLYLVELRQSTLESEDLQESISEAITILLVALLSGLWLLSRLLSKRIWKPFGETLTTINNFSLQSEQPIHFSTTKIHEFRVLNETLAGFTHKLRHDYLAQKRFTEQAAHEMQTPLAILRTKLELLIQSDSLKKEEALLVQDLFTASDRLSRLLKNMLLLARIGNRQYEETVVIDWKSRIEEQRQLYEEFILEKQLAVTINSTSNPRLKLHPVLADVLIGNLFQNAVRHNLQNGMLKIGLSENEILFQNSGAPLAVEPGNLFSKFVKGDASRSESNGLGLAIVKEIVEQSGCYIRYTIENELHTIRITR